MAIISDYVPNYQARDYDVIDYQMFALEGTHLYFRGPKPWALESKSYFTCIGAAQTLGCLCEQPFPRLLQTELGLSSLNLGYGGAGPYFFLKHAALLNYINRSKFVVIQVMSGRSESNSVFDSGGLELLTRRADGVRLGADSAYTKLLEGDSILCHIPWGKRYFRWISRQMRMPYLRHIIAETRRNWISNYHQLFTQITVPKILFWFSTRQPEYLDNYSCVSLLFNRFPQLVNCAMVQSIRQGCESYVECVTNQGLPQPLRSRFTGQPVMINPGCDRQDLGGKLWTENTYYPSPEMHEDAARMLRPVCQQYL